MIFLDLATPCWLMFAGHDLEHPAYAGQVQEAAAWIALLPDGEPVRHPCTGGFLSYTVRLFAGAESAAEFGRPALVDLLHGKPCRLVVVGHVASAAPGEVDRPADARAA